MLKISDYIDKRVAYRSQLSFKSEGSDPFKMVIKPFPEEMNSMSNYFNEFLIRNKIELELEDVNLTKQFNSCTILLYHTLVDYKQSSQMGWHCDSKFSLSGKFMENSNGQLINTPVVISTIGKGRYLKWRKRYTILKQTGRLSWDCDKANVVKMLQEEGHICILNPLDETPHFESGSKRIIQFQHGDIKINPNDISIAFVFRVSPHECLCRLENNRVALSPAIVAEINEKDKVSKVKQIHRTELYMTFDKEIYHEKLTNHFKSLFKKNK